MLRPGRAIPIVLFVVTGALGLGYQVLWSKDLHDLVGVSAWSQAAVLSAFMGGLALGSALIGPVADRVRRPLRLFALLEAVIGLYAFAYGPLARAASSLYLSLASASGVEGGDRLIGLKLAIAASLLLPPTVAMGGSYPAIFRHLTPDAERAGRWAAGLYAANAFGAAAGAVAIAFVVLPWLGLSSSLHLLGGLNLLVGAVAFAAAGWPGVASAPPPTAPASALPASPAPPPGDALSSSRTRLALLLLLLEGIAGFGLEIAWMRYFGLILGSTVYSFAIVVAVFVSGLALGSLVLAFVERRLSNPMAWFGVAQIALAWMLAAPLFLYPYLPWVFRRLSATLSTSADAFVLYEAAKAAVCFAVMLPATVVAGTALPLVIRAVSRDAGRLGASSGRAWAWDTCGNIAGALLAALLLLPAVGMETLLRLCALWSGFVGFVAVWSFTARTPRRPRRIGLAAAATALLALVALTLPRWQAEWFTLSPFTRAGSGEDLGSVRILLAGREVLLFRDDPAAHLMVVRLGQGRSLTLYVNGKADASSYHDMPTQLLAGHLPMTLSPGARDVLVVGLASGVTSGAILQHPVQRLDVVELVRDMPEATAFFAPWNHEPTADPRFHLVVDDARSFLAATTRQWDVIVSEPSNPWMAGTGSLFTLEHYRRAAAALRPGGLYVQWMQAYAIGDETLAAMVRSFVTVFPEVRVFQGNGTDLLLVGSRSTIEPEWASAEEAVRRPGVARDLASIGVESLPDLLLLEKMGPITTRLLAAAAPRPNTDDNQLVEHRAPLDLFQAARPTLPSALDERLRGSRSMLLSSYPGPVEPEVLRVLFRDDRTRVEPVSTAAALAWSHETGGSPPELGWAWKPFGDAELAAELDRAFAARDSRRVGSLLELYAAPILMRARLDPDVARTWLTREGSWPRPGSPRFRIDLLMAAGSERRARTELETWVAGPAPPPADWAAAVACEIDAAFCAEVLDHYLARGPVPVLERFRELQAVGSTALSGSGIRRGRANRNAMPTPSR